MNARLRRENERIVELENMIVSMLAAISTGSLE